MYWDTDGFAIWAKRLEAGVYKIPPGEPGARRIEITTEELAWSMLRAMWSPCG
jgi:transposase